MLLRRIAALVIPATVAGCSSSPEERGRWSRYPVPGALLSCRLGGAEALVNVVPLAADPWCSADQREGRMSTASDRQAGVRL